MKKTHREILVPPTRENSSGRLKICIVTRDIAGPVRNSRLGEAYRELALVLSRAGHDVSVLYATSAHCEDRSPRDWIKIYACEGIKLVPLPEGDIRFDAPPSVAISYRCYNWLKARSFDVVHFHVWQGVGYYSLLAHRQRLALQDALLCVELHDFWFWHKLRNAELVDDIDDLCIDFMEQQSVLLADYLLTPSERLVRCMEEKGIAIPESVFLIHDILPVPDQLNIPQQKGPEPTAVRVAPDEAKQAWANWHNYLSELVSPRRHRPKEVPFGTPLVSVCLTHYNRPELLRQAIGSLKDQDYSNFEVILVDDGSTLPEALAYLDEIGPEFAEKGWKIVRQENKYLGAARNNAARHAKGEYLLFMDDDDYAKPNEISLLTRAAEHSGADILTGAMDIFYGESVPTGETEFRRWLPLGGALALGAVTNWFGGANALWRRETFMELGGYTEDYGVGHEDWELFAKAVFHGAKLLAVPEDLYWYRVGKTGMASTTLPGLNMLRNLRPYLEVVPDRLRNTLYFAYGLRIKYDSMKREHEALELKHEELKREHEALRQKAKKLEERLNWMSATCSWRLTKPLRCIDGLLRESGFLMPRKKSTREGSARES